MDEKAIEADVKNYKIREGPLYKRSKFLKEWRERWIVLTTNYMYTFTSKNLDEVTDVIDLKEIKSYKSYLRKDQEMIPPGFKIRTADDMYYLCAKNCNEKWSWLVTLERLMDYKYVGTSNYNNADWIKTKGFDSQIDFESGKSKVGAVEPALDKQKSSEEAKKEVNDEADSILKQLEEQQKELQRMKSQLAQKEATLEKKEASFVLEQKKIEEEKAKLQQQQQQPSPVKQEPKKEPPVEPKPVEKPVEKPKEPESPTKTSQHQPSVSELRSMYENRKSDVSSQSVKPAPKFDQKKNQKKEDDINQHRSIIVNSLFEQFRNEAAFTNVLKYVTQFLINVAADQKCGYTPFVIIEGKTNHNKKNFAEVFTELLSVHDDYEKCENLMKFYEICIFQMPGVFTPEQIGKAQSKLKQFFNKVNNEEKLALIIKNMFIMQKLKKYNKADVHARLGKIAKEAKNEQARNWAQKLRDDLDK